MSDRRIDQPTAGLVRLTALALVGLGLAGCASTSPEQGDGPVRYAEITELREPEPTATPPEVQAPTIVAQFLAAWNRTDLTGEQWLSNIEQWCTRGYARQLLQNNKPSVRSAYRVTGTSTLTGRGNYSLTYTAPAADGTLTVSLTVQDGQWKVNGSHLSAANDPNGVPAPKPQAS